METNNYSVYSVFKRYRGEAIYIVSQYSTPIVGLVSNLVLLKYEMPETVGIFQSIQLYSTYFIFLSFGVFSGLNRNLSYYKGKNDTTSTYHATNSGFIFSIIISIISLAISGLIYILDKNTSEVNVKLSYSIFIATVTLQPIIIYFEILHKTNQDFAKLGNISLSYNLIYFILIPAIFIYNFLGFVIITLLKLAAQALFLISSKYKNIHLSFQLISILKQAKIGFPLMIGGFLYSSFIQFDQLYIAQNFDTIELGYYNLSKLIMTLFMIIPTSLGTLLYPKAAFKYGTSYNKSSLYPFFIKSLLLNIILIIPMVIITYYSIEPLVNIFLPKYVNGIKYAKISIIGGFGFIFVGPSVILGVLAKNKINTIILLLMSFLSYGLYFLNILKFSSIEVLIYYRNTIFIIYSVLIILHINYILKQQ